MRPPPIGTAITYDAIVDALARRGRLLHLIHLTGRIIRNLAIDELVIAGDCWDRGPRGDRVVDYLMQQPNVALTWGNHDAAWLGAALGQRGANLSGAPHLAALPAAVAVGGRLRHPDGSFGRGSFARCTRTTPRQASPSKARACARRCTMARMQKAAAVMQFKLEGQLIARHPEWQMEHRRSTAPDRPRGGDGRTRWGDLSP